MVVVDTDILVDLLRGRPGARDFLLGLEGRGPVCCSVITMAELFAGMRSKEEDVTRRLVAGMIVLPLTQVEADRAASLKREAKGYDLELDDCLIAATALAASAALATGNRKHYPFGTLELLVPDYR